MKYGALILSVGGTIAAAAQALGFVRSAGGIMLAANLITITWSLVLTIRDRRDRA